MWYTYKWNIGLGLTGIPVVKTLSFHCRWSESCSVMFESLWPHGLYGPWNSPDQNTGLGISRGSSQPRDRTEVWGLLHCRQILYQLSHKGSPRILEWVAYPFSSGSSWPRNPTRVSCIAGRFFTKWAIREKLGSISLNGQRFIDIYVFCFFLVKRRQFLPKSMVIIQSGYIINQWLPK